MFSCGVPDLVRGPLACDICHLADYFKLSVFVTNITSSVFFPSKIPCRGTSNLVRRFVCVKAPAVVDRLSSDFVRWWFVHLRGVSVLIFDRLFL